MRGAAAQCAGARIKDAVDHLSAVVMDVFRVAFLQCLVGVMADKEIPAHRVVLGGKTVERRHVVIVGQSVDAGLIIVGAGEQARVAAGFEQQHAPPGLGQPRRQGAAARTRPDDDVIEVVIAVHLVCPAKCGSSVCPQHRDHRGGANIVTVPKLLRY